MNLTCLKELVVPESCQRVSFINGIINGLNDLIYEFNEATIGLDAELQINTSGFDDPIVRELVEEYYSIVEGVMFSIKDRISLLRDKTFNWIDPGAITTVSESMNVIISIITEATETMELSRSNYDEFLNELKTAYNSL